MHADSCIVLIIFISLSLVEKSKIEEIKINNKTDVLFSSLE